MALMDTVRQLMKGRSDTLERGVDKAMGYLGSYSDRLKRQAETVKAKARTLDPDRGETEPSGAAPDPHGPPHSAAPPARPAAPTTTEGGSLRGDLVDGPETPARPPDA